MKHKSEENLVSIKSDEYKIIRRWRLEPSDIKAYNNGELVDPIKPIIYYLDPATPIKWRPYFIKGIEDWNKVFEKAGFNILWSNENDPYCIRSFKYNYKHQLYIDDIRKINFKKLKSVDVLVGGFPCQAFFKFSFFSHFGTNLCS